MGSMTQSEFQNQKGAVDINLTAGPQWASSYDLLSIMYIRKRTEAINIFVEVIAGGQLFVIDRVLGTGDTSYVFPNQRVPYKIALSNGMKIIFRTENVSAGDEDHSVIVQWADFVG